MPEHGFYVFARIGERDAPIAHLPRKSWARQVARLVSRDNRLDPRPDCRVVASSEDVDWLLWDRDMQDIEEEVMYSEISWGAETGEELPRDAMLSPITYPPIKLTPIARSMVVAHLLVDVLPNLRDRRITSALRIVLSEPEARALLFLNNQKMARSRVYIADNAPMARTSVNNAVAALIDHGFVNDRGRNTGVEITPQGREWVQHEAP